MAGASADAGQPAHHGRVTSWLSEVFRLDATALNWPRGVLFLDIAMVPLIVFWSIGHEQYLLSALLGALFTIVMDPGGAIMHRIFRLAIFGLVGAGVTALGFSLSSVAWGWLVLASFLVTLAAGLAVGVGLHAAAGGLLLNVWFIVAVAVGQGLHNETRISDHTWAQVAAWAGGSALWIVVAVVVWLVSGRQETPQPVAEIPADMSPRGLTPAVLAFSALRALAIAGAVALAFGLGLAHALWLPIATIIALKSDLQQSTLTAAQRIVGALIGAITAGLLLLIPANEHGLRLFSIQRGLEVVAIVLIVHAVAIRFWNYAAYTAAIAAAVLILADLPQPSDLSAEGYRVAWTVAGVGIGVLVTLLATQLAKRSGRS